MKILLLLLITGINTLAAQKIDSLPAHVYRWESQNETKKDERSARGIMEGSTSCLAHFEVNAFTLAPGNAPGNSHTYLDEEELIIIKEGQLKIRINDTDKIMGTGSIAYFMPGEAYGIENGGGKTAVYYSFKYRSKLPMNSTPGKQSGGSFLVNWNDLPVEKTDKGHRRAFFNRPTSQLQKHEMHTTALGPGLNSHAPHAHKEEEIILLLKGNVQMFIAGTLHNASPGDIVFLPSGVLHALKNTGKAECEYFAFQWKN